MNDNLVTDGLGKIRLYNGDCIEVMQDLISKGVKVDLTVTSPPYDNLRTYNGTCEWNFEIFKKVAQCLYDITSDGGVVVWVVGDATIKGSETGTSFRQALYFKDIGFNLHDTMIWNKTKVVPLDPKCNRYWQSFEYMFILSKGKPKSCNYIKEPCKHAGKKAIAYQYEADRRKRIDRVENQKNHVVKENKVKSNVWLFTPVKSENHPAPFPEQLGNDHIISWSNEGDLVLDCFMGSGTTGKMAVLNNRRFIGIEKVKEYFDISEKRINNATNNRQLKLF